MLVLNMNKEINKQTKQIHLSIVTLESYIPQVKEYRNALSLELINHVKKNPG